MATFTHPHADQVKVASGLDVLAAIWLFISAFIVHMNLSLAWSTGIVAVIIFILACVRAFGAYGVVSLSWINALLGLWVLISPWVIRPMPMHQAVMNNVITGIIVIILAVWSALATSTEMGSSGSPPPTVA
jgi:hypothetical protein